MKKKKITGKVTQGYRIASGLNKEGIPGPGGIILKESFPRQRGFFEKEIPEMKEMWTGTINVNISPRTHTMLAFDHEITCEWHPGITETFGIVKNVTLIRDGKEYPAMIYYPFASDIHIPRLDTIEVLAPKVEGLKYGETVSLLVPEDKISIEEK
jgi:hypothetical protein